MPSMPLGWMRIRGGRRCIFLLANRESEQPQRLISIVNRRFVYERARKKACDCEWASRWLVYCSFNAWSFVRVGNTSLISDGDFFARTHSIENLSAHTIWLYFVVAFVEFACVLKYISIHESMNVSMRIFSRAGLFSHGLRILCVPHCPKPAFNHVLAETAYRSHALAEWTSENDEIDVLKCWPTLTLIEWPIRSILK